MSPNPASSMPIDFLLKSFNALDPAVAAEPTQILYNLLDSRLAPLNESQVNRSETQPTFHPIYSEDESVESSYASTAASVGLKGSYGVYSGSVKAEAKKETDTSSKTFHSSFTASISSGTLLFKDSDSSPAVTACLAPTVVSALNSIKTLADAEAFTKAHGTHVVLGVNLGGSLSVVIEIASRSFSEKVDLSVEVEAAYNGIGSMSALANASSSTKKAAGSSSLRQELKVLGGSLATISNIDIDDEASIKAWAGSCGTDSVSGLFKSVEFWQLATDSTARGLLSHYLDLCVLKRSLENPVVFSKNVPVSTGQYVSATATAGQGYKIISGGAWTSATGSDFLAASFPALDSQQAINGWKAISHDCFVASTGADDLVAYALGVYDPANLLSISCTHAAGTNPTSGADHASVAVAAGYLLVGGGAETSTTQPDPRYLTGTFPVADSGTDYSTWVGRGHDYGTASAAALTVWAVGLKMNGSTEITISKDVVTEQGGLQSHGTSFAALGGGRKVAGGGVMLDQHGGSSPDTLQNLLHASFPTSQDEIFGWQEFNGDLNGVFDAVNATAYAFALKVTSNVPGVSYQPFSRQSAHKALALAETETVA